MNRRFTPEENHFSELLALKYGPVDDEIGWSPKLRERFGYHTPDDYYEATLLSLVNSDTEWLDVGCGRSIFSSNPNTAKLLSKRCKLLVGLDPNDNIDQNIIVHERNKCTLEEYHTDKNFDLITLRMVAEHIENPSAAVSALSRLAKPGGLVIIYTVYKWAPSAIIAAMTPISVHHRVKRFLWEGKEEDTFPTAYRMNTRAELKSIFEQAAFREANFIYLDDCRSLQRWKLSAVSELSLWKGLKQLNINYPELGLLGIYEKK